MTAAAARYGSLTWPAADQESGCQRLVEKPMPHVNRRSPAACSVIILAAMVDVSCHSSPTQPSTTPTAEWRDLTHFEEIVGTNWMGTARFTTIEGAAATSDVSIYFVWNNVCDIRDQYGAVWCSQGYNPFGWGTVDGLTIRIRGYESASVKGSYNRYLNIGEDPTLGSGNWNTARVSGDRQRLVIASSDFSWDQRRGVRFDLTRVPWPSDVACPSFRSCGSS
jgi:hypothetical protein